MIWALRQRSVVLHSLIIIEPLLTVERRFCSIWAIDIAEDPKLDATVVAFDISDKFFPPTAWLPSNLTLCIHDILRPFPDNLLRTFEVLHLRLFLTLTAEKLGRIIENAITLLSESTIILFLINICKNRDEAALTLLHRLEPGGYIQWVEHDKTDLKPITASLGQDSSAVEALIELEKNPFPNYNAT